MLRMPLTYDENSYVKLNDIVKQVSYFTDAKRSRNAITMMQLFLRQTVV